MNAEPLSRQRQLVGRPLRMSDAEIRSKYVFPFMDESWSVTFSLIDTMTQGPRLFRGALEVRADGLRSQETSSKLEPITTVPVARFDDVVHFDPWWTFRGIAGVDRPRVNAVLASNLAGTFNHEGTTYKVHDLEFDPGLTGLKGLVAQDAFFRARVFRKGDLGLLQLRKPRRT